MKRFLPVLLACAAANAAIAANAPFVQIAGSSSALAGSCRASDTTYSLPVNLSIPAGTSFSYTVSYASNDMTMTDMDMMMMYMSGGVSWQTLFMSAPQNGPVADANAPLALGSGRAWYTYQGNVADHTSLSVTITAYTGPNGTGSVASTSTLAWDCSTGGVQSMAHMGNAAGSAPSSLEKAVAVEYYHAGLGHYFMTASGSEIAALDAGQMTGWARTGQSFNVFANAAPGTDAVCRFLIPPELGNSHFYAASTAECAAVRARYPAFTLESAAVFHAAQPNVTTGTCPAMSVPVYRLWNGRADINHRYTADANVKARMVAAGYVPEGYGPDAVIMCSPL